MKICIVGTNSRRIYRFKGKELERGRKYLWRKEFVPLLFRYLDLRKGQTVADIGCGTGFLSRLMARKVGDTGKVIGVDKDGALLRIARALAEDGGLGSVVSFRKGSAENLPLQDSSYDRIVCQALLWVLRDPRVTLREMIRVCKPGGIVAAIEGGFDYVTWYDPRNPRLTELESKVIGASTLGHKKLYGADRGIGYKLAPIFRELGLSRIRLDAYAYVWLGADDRIPRSFKLIDHRDFVRRYHAPLDKQRREFRRVLQTGGMTRSEIEEIRRLNYDSSRRFVDNPTLLDEDYSMNAGIFYITTGIKFPAS